MKSNKKAFTIVELVIVIAVIAILAAVLIPTFSNLIKRSKVSADQQLIRNLNSALKADLKDHKTMTDALAAAEEFGYNVSKINKSATDNEILWDSKNDVFCYFESDKGGITYIPETTLKVAKDQLKDVDYWVIAKTPSNKYSTYLYNTELTDIDNLTTGLDVGNETITSISYVGGASAQTVTIVTNGGSLTINAKNDSVIHYGYADTVNIIDVASASYHEKDTVKFLEVAAGHVVLEATAKVTAFHFTATGEGDAAKFENADGKKISVDLSNVPTENLPSFSRDAVTIAQNGTYVAEVKTDKTEFIWLFGYGIKEQMVATTLEGAIAENGVLNIGITAGAEDGSVAEQIANPAKRNSQGQLVDNANNVVSIENAVVEKLPSKEDVQTGATLFAGGTGTASDPYLISNREELENIYKSHTTGYLGTYYKVKDGVKEIDCSNWTPIWIEANFDGNGVTLSNLDAPLFSFVGYNYDSPVFKNFNVVANMHYNEDRAAIIIYNYAKTQVTFENVNVSGIIESSLGASTFFGYGKSTINLINCISTANLVATGGGVSGIVNHPRYGAGSETYINIKDSAFIGNMSYKGGIPGYFGTNYWSATVTAEYSNDFISKYGDPNGTLYNQPAGSVDENGVISFTGSESIRYIASGKTAVLTSYTINLPDLGESFSIDKIAGASKVTVTLEIGANDENGTGNYVATYEIEEIDVSDYETGDAITTNKIKNFEVIVVPANNTDKTTGASGATYYVVSGRNGSTYGSAVVRITQYDSVGNVIGIGSVSIAK